MIQQFRHSLRLPLRVLCSSVLQNRTTRTNSYAVPGVLSPGTQSGPVLRAALYSPELELLDANPQSVKGTR